jgi:hypothetical protein
VSRLLQQILADDELIDAIAAAQIPRQRGAPLAEVLAQIRSALLAGELTLVDMDPPGGVPDRADAPDEDNEQCLKPVDDHGGVVPSRSS